MINFNQSNLYCKEDISLIENYEKAIADTTQTWVCHHRLGLIVPYELLEERNMYLNRPAFELIFLTSSDHAALHNKQRKGLIPWNKGKTGIYSDEVRYKMGKANREKTAWNKGKSGIYSEETLKKMSESQKGEKHPMYGKVGKNKGKHRVYDDKDRKIFHLE